jgi:hypothetical protein
MAGDLALAVSAADRDMVGETPRMVVDYWLLLRGTSHEQQTSGQRFRGITHAL